MSLREFEKAQKVLSKAERALTRRLDELEAVQGGVKPEAVPGCIKVAKEAMQACEEASEALEVIRYEYWRERRETALARLIELAAPLLDEVVACSQAGCQAGASTPVDVLRQVLDAPRPKFDVSTTKVPAGKILSEPLQRAWDEFYWQTPWHDTHEIMTRGLHGRK